MCPPLTCANTSDTRGARQTLQHSLEASELTFLPHTYIEITSKQYSINIDLPSNLEFLDFVEQHFGLPLREMLSNRL